MGEALRQFLEQFGEIGLFYDGAYAAHGLDDLARAGALDDADSVAVLARLCDRSTAIHQCLAERAPAAIVAGVSSVLCEGGGERSKTTTPLLRARLQQALLSDPSLAATLTGAARALGDGLLVEGGALLPAAPWRSPWAARPRSKRVAAPPTAPWPERLVTSDGPAVPELDDNPGIGDQAQLQHHFRISPALYWLMRMEDDVARRLWLAVPVERLHWANPQEVQALLARFGLVGLDSALAVVARHRDCAAGLSSVESARVAPLMAAALGGRPDAVPVARAWFDRFPEAGTVGLIPAAFDGERATSTRAITALRALRRRTPDGFARGLELYDDAVRAALLDLLERTELPARRPVLPSTLAVAGLSRPRTRDGAAALQGEPLAELLQLLKVAPLDGAPWLDEVRDAFTSDSLGRLASALFEAWLAAGAPPKERWMIHASAHFPDDQNAALLATFAAEWAPQGKSARAQALCEVLGAMGTRAGLERVHHLKRKVRSRAFRARAELVFVAAAERLGLSEDELAERLVPDFGLTPDGALPVEPPVRLALDGAAPRFLDVAGKVVKALPAVDDEELGAQLRDLKKRAAALIREAIARLERRMVEARRMSVEHFAEVYLMHGVLRRVAERLVFGVYAGGALEAAVTLAPVGVVDLRGAPLVLALDRQIGVLHPLELRDHERAAWSERLPAQPFEQLSRRCRRFSSAGELRVELARYVNLEAGAPGILRLEKLGWQRGPVEDGGCYRDVTRSLPGGRVSVEIDPGIFIGAPMQHEQQRIHRVDVALSDAAPAISLSEIERDFFTTLPT